MGRHAGSTPSPIKLTRQREAGAGQQATAQAAPWRGAAGRQARARRRGARRV